MLMISYCRSFAVVAMVRPYRSEDSVNGYDTPCSSSYTYVNGRLLSVPSISINTVRNSSNVRKALPTTFFKHLLTLLTSLSQKPPCQGGLLDDELPRDPLVSHIAFDLLRSRYLRNFLRSRSKCFCIIR